MRREVRWFLSAVAFLALTTGAAADQNDPRLDDLFVRLKGSADDRAAGRIEQRIWQIWIEFDDRAVSRLMAEGIGAMVHRRLPEALDRFDRVVDLAPDFAEAWNKRATVHFLMGDYEASVVDVQKTLELEPRHFGALSGLGMIFDALEAPEAALKTFEAALEVHPHMGGPRQRVSELRELLRGRDT